MEILGFDISVYLLLIPGMCLLMYVYGTWTFGYWKSRGIPGPPPKPFFGNTRDMVYTGFAQSLWAYSQKYGRIYGLYSGRKPMIVINDLDILKEILVKDFGHFTNRFEQNRLLQQEAQKNVFFARDNDWRRIRHIITPTFSAGKLKLMEHYINRCSADLAGNIEEIAKRGDALDTKEYFGAYTMDVIAGTSFGLQVNSQKDLNEPFVTNAKKMMSGGGRLGFLNVILLPSKQDAAPTRFPVVNDEETSVRCGAPHTRFLVVYNWEALFLPFLAPLLQALRENIFKIKEADFFFRSIDMMLQERKQEQTDRRKPDFLQLLINAEATDDFVLTVGNEKRLTREEIVGQVFLFFIAGYETTSTALQYLFYNLTKFPEIQEKIVEEIAQTLGGDTPTYDNVGKLKFLEQTIYETLRLYPPVATITRVASKTVTIKGLTIEKGTGVMIPICDVLRDAAYFSDPQLFKPERFSDSCKGTMNPVAFLPFGFGPRLCIGMRLALLEIKIAVVHVLKRVKFVKTDDLPETVIFKPTGGLLHPAEPIKTKVVLRQPEQAS